MKVGDTPPVGGLHGPAPPPEKTAGAGATKRAFVEVLSEGKGPAAATPPPPATARPPEVARAPAASPTRESLQKFLQGAIDAEKEIDTVLKAAARGKTFSAGELLALQSKVFRYSQSVEVISRGLDKLVGAVKQTLGTQV